MFAGWHNLEYFSLSPRDRPQHYVAIPSCWGSWEPARALNDPTPPVFAYLSGHALSPSVGSRGEIGMRFSILMSISLSESTVAAFIKFLINASKGVGYSKGGNARMCDFAAAEGVPGIREPSFVGTDALPSAHELTGCLFPLQRKLSDVIFGFGVFTIVAGTRFDEGRGLLALERSMEVPWAEVDADGGCGQGAPFLAYAFASGGVLPVPASGGLPAVAAPQLESCALLSECVEKAREYFADKRARRGKLRPDDMDVEQCAGLSQPGTDVVSDDVEVGLGVAIRREPTTHA